MTNKEHWKDKIVDLVIDGGLIAVINGKPALCKVTHCENCDIKRTEDSCYNELLYWLNSEYISEKIQPEVKNCKVDTPILVKSNAGDVWFERHFAKFEYETVYAQDDGRTSFTEEECSGWEMAKLANDEDKEK